jgi:hypothetical protein
MPIEAALIKPVVDALMALFRESNDIKLKRNAEASLREAIRELLLANPDENKAQARIAIAKAAGILSEDVVLAEDMLQKHRATKAKTAGKAGSGRKRKPAAPAEPAKAPEKALKAEKTDKADEADKAGASAGRKPRKPASRR